MRSLISGSEMWQLAKQNLPKYQEPSFPIDYDLKRFKTTYIQKSVQLASVP